MHVDSFTEQCDFLFFYPQTIRLKDFFILNCYK